MITHICNSQLQLSARIILLYMVEVGEYQGNYNHLAQEIGLSQKTCKASLNRLHTLGFVRMTKGIDYGKKSMSSIKVKYEGK